MYRLLVWTSKGGSGKTTTVANAAPELTKLGYRVLMVGFDPQANLEKTYGVDLQSETVTRIEQVLDDPTRARDALIDVPVPDMPRRRRGRPQGSLQLLPCSPELNRITVEVGANENYTLLDQLLETLDDVADLALIDTQGALTPISLTAAHAADGVLFVGEPGVYETEALIDRLDELTQISDQLGRDIATVGTIFMRTAARSKGLRTYGDHYAAQGLYVFQAHTRQQTSVHDHPGFGMPTVFVEPKSHVAQDYAAIASELADRLTAMRDQGGDQP